MCNIHTHIDTHMFLHINYKWMVYILNTNYNYITHTHILVPLGDRCKSEKSQSQRERGQAPLHTHGWSSCLHCFSGWALCCSPVIWPGAPHPWADGRKVAASPLPPPPGCEGQLLPFSSTEEVSRHMKPSLPKIPPLSYGSVTGLPQPPLQEVCLTCLSPPLPPSLSLLFPPHSLAGPFCIWALFRGCLTHGSFCGLPCRPFPRPLPPRIPPERILDLLCSPLIGCVFPSNSLRADALPHYLCVSKNFAFIESRNTCLDKFF